MITEERAYTMFVEADPAPADTREHESPLASTYLVDLRQRELEMTQLKTEKEREVHKKNRGPLIAAAVAAALLIATIGIVLANQNEAPIVDEPEPVVTTVVQASIDGLGSANSFIEAYSNGDPDAVLALLTADVVVGDSFGDQQADFDDWSQQMAWYVAQGTKMVDPTCTETGQQEGTVLVSCVLHQFTPVESLANANGVRTTVDLSIGSEGISSVYFNYGQVGGFIIDPFVAWANAQGAPQGVYYGNWTSMEEAIEHAAARAEWAQIWIDSRVQVVLDAMVAYNTGNAGEFVSRFSPTSNVFLVDHEDALEAFASTFAQGDKAVVDQCVPTGVAPVGDGVYVVCDMTFTNEYLELAGIVVAGQATMTVGADDLIVNMDDGLDYGLTWEYFADFRAWLLETYPDVHDQVTWTLDTQPSAESFDAVAPYYAEFVDQSDKYPIGG